MSKKTNAKPTARRASTSAKSDGRNVRLKPANPFDLIRLIAHSQSDPRKALAELVQNSLDANANQIVVSRLRRRGEVIITVVDDGGGIFRDMERPDALERLATNVGHSFKRNMSVAERQQQMLLGKYGIGLLGFWCVGQEMEIRTRVAASDVWQLRLVRDEPNAEVRRIKQTRIPFETDTWTEIVIRGVHPGPARQLSARRLGEYLGAELRGQLLSRDVKLRMVDHLTRQPSLRDFLVVPQRFDGRLLEQFGEVPVPGFPSAKLELYLLEPEAERRSCVALACGGTIVADDIAAIDGYELDVSLWGWQRLEGIVEFPALDVAPSTRRGFSPSPAADAIFAALRAIEPKLQELFDQEKTQRDVVQDESLAREIRNVFRPLVMSLPQYDFFEVRGEPANPMGTKKQSAANAANPSQGEMAEGNAVTEGASIGAESPFSQLWSNLEQTPQGSEVVEAGDTPPAPPQLFDPGPLHAVRVVPAKSRLLPGATRTLTAKPLDEEGRLIEDGITFQWQIVEGLGQLDSENDKAAFAAGSQLGHVKISVTATQGELSRAGTAELDIVPKLAGENPDAGIPDPRRAFDPNGDWRSRVLNGQWEYNAAHPDYHAVADDPKPRLRYLVHLFAKEIVLHNYGEPKDTRLLEHMVEVLTHIRSKAF